MQIVYRTVGAVTEKASTGTKQVWSPWRPGNRAEVIYKCNALPSWNRCQPVNLAADEQAAPETMSMRLPDWQVLTPTWSEYSCLRDPTTEVIGPELARLPIPTACLGMTPLLGGHSLLNAVLELRDLRVCQFGELRTFTQPPTVSPTKFWKPRQSCAA